MTLPALTAEQLAVLKVHATASAWAYHQTTVPEAERVDTAASYSVHGDLRLVAADVLETACLHATGNAGDGKAATKRIEVGPIKVEKVVKATATAAEVNADAWCQRAARLRREAGQAGRSSIVASPLASMRSGSRAEPVFRITGREGGPTW